MHTIAIVFACAMAAYSLIMIIYFGYKLFIEKHEDDINLDDHEHKIS